MPKTAKMGDHLCLRRKPDTMQESIKARLGTQPIKTPVNCKKGHLEVRALLASLLEPGKSLIVSAQACIRRRKEKGVGRLLLGFQPSVESACRSWHLMKFVPHGKARHITIPDF
jgi:hypothetical protein